MNGTRQGWDTKKNKAQPKAARTVGHLEALEFDRLDVVDEGGHLLRGVDLAAGRPLRKHRVRHHPL